MSDLVRATVNVSPDTGETFRQRMSAEYPDIPDIAQTSLGLLIRFMLLIYNGIPVDIAKRSLRQLPRGVNKRDGITV